MYHQRECILIYPQLSYPLRSLSERERRTELINFKQTLNSLELWTQGDGQRKINWSYSQFKQ